MQQVLLRPGAVVHVGEQASVQFKGERALTFQVIRIEPRTTYDGWLWLEGFVLGPGGEPVRRRRIFVCAEGLLPAYATVSSGTP